MRHFPKRPRKKNAKRQENVTIIRKKNTIFD